MLPPGVMFGPTLILNHRLYVQWWPAVNKPVQNRLQGVFVLQLGRGGEHRPSSWCICSRFIILYVVDAFLRIKWFTCMWEESLMKRGAEQEQWGGERSGSSFSDWFWWGLDTEVWPVDITQEVQVNQNWTLTIYDIEMNAVIRGHPVWAPLMSGQR